jgi:hypothetical protein
MLSFSSYGVVDCPFTRKVRRTSEIAKELAPDLQLSTALNKIFGERSIFPFQS